jgi:hypothetical protein
MSYPYYQRDERVTGPACVRYYDHNMVLPDPDMRCEPGLRLQLSKAVSHLYFVQPHSIILSQIESRPLRDYHCPSAYQQASMLYFGGSSPRKDLHDCIASIRGKRFNTNSIMFRLYLMLSPTLPSFIFLLLHNHQQRLIWYQFISQFGDNSAARQFRF